ncbi:MAG: 3-methyl-2-oxobutanoate hydroxymethyltransferase [Deferribacterota bacterium]|nr:3-methyl-2-oxobutanoate hydroxymethyltransferase [Deferribacterota bacterium]
MAKNPNKKITITDLKEKKYSDNKIACLTCYDYYSAKILDSCDIDLVLVGDSLGMVFKGEENTLSVTVDEIIYHTKAVKRGLKRAFLTADMPFGSYQKSREYALENAIRIIKEGGAEAVKLEGGVEVANIVRDLSNFGINVIAHIGLMPQYVHKLGGYKKQGKEDRVKNKLLEDALALEEAGASLIVLEGIYHDIASIITEKTKIPTIGIGAGSGCDGQILVFQDYLGINIDFIPPFVKKYANLAEDIKKATNKYIEEVKKGVFPQ